MSNYVDIRSSIADIIGLANNLKVAGEGLEGTMTTAMSTITNLEGGPETFPRDEFTEAFLEHYHRSVEASDGTSLPANEAIKTSAPELGTAMAALGDFVTNAMWAYSAGDDGNAGDIAGSTSV
ncbi:hypothetical protein [Polymorphospora rubra]|uniref:Uncharacterized protein n=1 Tax=Polymorphospora rubra TaxID=338584 RepID=A0A810N5F7_9ACTN|nr:hypothetical protein [Polymorphospora rubra]BCJ68636.1 hypothetical protein Prubr_56570 [Polymorphospora rubra]